MPAPAPVSIAGPVLESPARVGFPLEASDEWQADSSRTDHDGVNREWAHNRSDYRDGQDQDGATQAWTGPDGRDLSSLDRLSTRRLRQLCNEAFRHLDWGVPPVGTVEVYECLVEELTQREEAARTAADVVPCHGPGRWSKQRKAFRDNVFSSRFEVLHDGELAGYLKYRLTKGRLELLQCVANPGFQRTEAAETVIRASLLHAHRRRLDIRIFCPEVHRFLQGHPAFRSLTGTHRQTRHTSGQEHPALLASSS
jgi:hypothetical protein